jgi:opacity protein-like surface antigen
MKKITLLSLTVLLIASISNAQITKGSTYLGGQISGSTYKYENGSSSQKQSSISVSPAIGTAIKQNLIAGIDLTYAHTKNDNGFNAVIKGNDLGGGFFLRRYASIANRFYFFLQGRAGYFHEKNESTSGSSVNSNQSNNFNLGLYPGVSFALTKSLHIEAGLNNLVLVNYSHSVYKQPTSPNQTSNSFNFSTSASGTNLSFALRFIIPKK